MKGIKDQTTKNRSCYPEMIVDKYCVYENKVGTANIVNTLWSLLQTIKFYGTEF